MSTREPYTIDERLRVRNCLITLRKRLEWTQMDMARVLECSQPRISYWESKYMIPSGMFVVRLMCLMEEYGHPDLAKELKTLIGRLEDWDR